jgi:hypothetical protein
VAGGCLRRDRAETLAQFVLAAPPAPPGAEPLDTLVR